MVFSIVVGVEWAFEESQFLAGREVDFFLFPHLYFSLVSVQAEAARIWKHTNKPHESLKILEAARL